MKGKYKRGKYIRASDIGSATFCKRTVSLAVSGASMTNQGKMNIDRGEQAHNVFNERAVHFDTAENVGLFTRIIRFILRIFGIKR